MQENLPIVVWDQAPPALSWEQKIEYLAHQFMQLPQQETPVEHSFEAGWYIRTMKIPADTFFLGRRHTLGHEVILAAGEVVQITPSGNHHLVAPSTIHSTPGFHAVFYAITDVIGITRHPNPTESRDTLALENAYFEPAELMAERGRLHHERVLT